MIRRHRDSVQGQLHMRTITTLLRMVLQLNNFEFNGDHYLQVGGTAMGTRVAPTFANIFMAHFERQHVYSYPLQPSMWLRFIDDIFMLWDHGQHELSSFIDHLNQAHDTIKFTRESSPHKVHFLDMWVIKTGTCLHTDLYVKPTDCNATLHFRSAHPTHCRRGIRSHTQDFLKHGLIKVKHFIDRGYPKGPLLQDLLRATLQDRTLLVQATCQTPTQQQAQPQILVTTFHPAFKGL